MSDLFEHIPGSDYGSPLNCSHLRCNVCGERVERGIMSVDNHMRKPHASIDHIPYGQNWDYELDVLKAKLHQRIEARWTLFKFAADDVLAMYRQTGHLVYNNLRHGGIYVKRRFVPQDPVA